MESHRLHTKLPTSIVQNFVSRYFFDMNESDEGVLKANRCSCCEDLVDQSHNLRFAGVARLMKFGE
jgi:hypothetical protein